MAYPWESELPALAALSDEDAAAAINALTVVARRPVPREQLKKYIYLNGIWYAMQKAANDAATPEQAKAVLQSGLAYLSDPDFTTYDMDDPQGAAMISQLVAIGVCSQDQAAAVNAMANVTTPKYPNGATPAEVKAARAT